MVTSRAVRACLIVTVCAAGVAPDAARVACAQPARAAPVAPSPSPFVEQFIAWAEAPGLEKQRYELPDGSPGYRPVIRAPYAHAHFTNPRLRAVQVCPLISGVCSKSENGFELALDVTVSGVKLPGILVQFNQTRQIVKYESGPLSEITHVISAAAAARVAKDAAVCRVGGLSADTTTKPWMTSYIKGGFNIYHGKIRPNEVPPDGSGVLYWQFPTKGELPSHCIGAVCDVDAVTGKARWSWRCL